MRSLTPHRMAALRVEFMEASRALRIVPGLRLRVIRQRSRNAGEVDPAERGAGVAHVRVADHSALACHRTLLVGQDPSDGGLDAMPLEGGAGISLAGGGKPPVVPGHHHSQHRDVLFSSPAELFPFLHEAVLEPVSFGSHAPALLLQLPECLPLLQPRTARSESRISS
jgi:hypothetical protein